MHCNNFGELLKTVSTCSFHDGLLDWIIIHHFPLTSHILMLGFKTDKNGFSFDMLYWLESGFVSSEMETLPLSWQLKHMYTCVHAHTHTSPFAVGWVLKNNYLSTHTHTCVFIPSFWHETETIKELQQIRMLVCQCVCGNVVVDDVFKIYLYT